MVSREADLRQHIGQQVGGRGGADLHFRTNGQVFRRLRIVGRDCPIDYTNTP